MLILAIETTGKTGCVALARDGEVIVERYLDGKLSHGRDLVPAIDAVFAETGSSRSDVGLVCVSGGPGSFTGLRVGVTCAKALSYALGKPVVSVPTLEVMAWNAAGMAGHVCPVMDARRERVYAALFKDDGTGGLATVWPTRLIPPGDLPALLPEDTLVFGNGAGRYPEFFKRFRIGAAELQNGRAAVVARLGFERFRKGMTENPISLVPNYCRLSDVEEKYGQTGPNDPGR
ncbi:MAG TPA: tRNA (adenosine(37)-N6)-threonylcarbamoyltransferase complex dimerization subunit type 1 TsaB [Candidatus Brocadiia bacterium]|nr:tRNA (adenosine(37)-N6)-threonylcarbamoyltransferase complex dimerization subunit type 1 TsaB [Candidatus Brocadiia bacterium]